MGRPPVHGHTRNGKPTNTWTSWDAMLKRCRQVAHVAYRRYGGRGIRVCERWQDFESFLADMGERPAGTSIDRINNDGDYEPGNCRWATRSEQARNRTSNVLVTFDGETLSLVEWAERKGLPRKALELRVRKGWAIERALTQPLRLTQRQSRQRA